MGGKIVLATALVVPFKEKIGEVVPPVTGELRIQPNGTSGHGSSANSTHGHDHKSSSGRGGGGSDAPPTTRGVPAGLGHASAGPPLIAPGDSGGTSFEAIMAAVDPDGYNSAASTLKAQGFGDDGDDGYDAMENARGDAEARDTDGATGVSGRVCGNGRGGDKELGSSGSGSGKGGSSALRRLQRVEEEDHRGGGGTSGAGGSGESTPGCKEDEHGCWEGRDGNEEGKEEEEDCSTTSLKGEEKQGDAAPSHDGGGA